MTEGPEPQPGPVREIADTMAGIGRGVFHLWQVALSASARALGVTWNRGVRAARSWLAQWERVRVYHVAPSRSWKDFATAEAAAALGLRAFIAGMGLAGLSVGLSRNSYLAAIVLISIEVLWAASRFIIIALLVPRGSISRRSLSVAFLAGLLPYLVGITPTLRLAALLASGVLTARGLRAAGIDRIDTVRAIAWSFGGQLAVTAAGWALGALIALIAVS